LSGQTILKRVKIKSFPIYPMGSSWTFPAVIFGVFAMCTCMIALYSSVYKAVCE